MACLLIGLFAHIPQLAVAQPDAAIRCEFRDTYFLPRQLDEFGTRCGYVLLFTTIGEPASELLLSEVAKVQTLLQQQGILIVNLDISGEASLLDVALQAMQREASFPHGLDADSCFRDTFGIRAPGQVVLLDALQRPLYKGPASTWEDGLNSLLAGEAGHWPEGSPPIERLSEEQPAVSTTGGALTFTQHIAPVIRENCMPCHADKGMAPFALETYQDISTRSAMIAEVVRMGTMPPWYAHGGDITFQNPPKITSAQRKWFQQWHDAGRPEGSVVAGAEASIPAVDESNAFTADLRITASEPVQVPATGFLEYQRVVLPVVAEADVWIQGLRIVPSNPRVMHHALLIVASPAPQGGEDQSYLIALAAVGTQATRYPDGIAAKIPKGSRLAFNIHYEPTGKPEEDVIALELMFPRQPVQKRTRFVGLTNLDFSIPPHAERHEVVAEQSLERSLSVFGILAHMHLRGKSAQIVAEKRDGSISNLLVLPAWNFNWQMIYEVAAGDAVLASGTKLRMHAYFDNSVQNPYNPAPDVVVRTGKQTTDEMMDAVIMGVHPFESLNIVVDAEQQRDDLRHETFAPR